MYHDSCGSTDEEDAACSLEMLDEAGSLDQRAPSRRINGGLCITPVLSRPLVKTDKISRVRTPGSPLTRSTSAKQLACALALASSFKEGALLARTHLQTDHHDPRPATTDDATNITARTYQNRWKHVVESRKPAPGGVATAQFCADPLDCLYGVHIGPPQRSSC